MPSWLRMYLVEYLHAKTGLNMSVERLESRHRETVAWATRGAVSSVWVSAAAAMAGVALTSLTCNAAVLAALWRSKRVPMHYPLASLALADMLLSLFVMPLAAARELFVFELSWPICACWSTLDVLGCTASILSICTLGWERWRGITTPLARADRTRQAKMYAVLVWPTATLVAMPTAFIPSPMHHLPGELAKACSVNINVGYVFFSVSFSFYIPAVVMLVMYGRILKALSNPPTIRTHRGGSPRPHVICSPQKIANQCAATVQDAVANQTPKKLPGTPKNILNIPKEAAALYRASFIKAPVSLAALVFRQRRATKTIIKLMAMFLLCWTPFFIMLPVDSLCECVWDTTWEWCTWLGYTNSALNPLIYAAASPSVRRALRNSFSGSAKHTRSSDVQMNSGSRGELV